MKFKSINYLSKRDNDFFKSHFSVVNLVISKLREHPKKALASTHTLLHTLSIKFMIDLQVDKIKISQCHPMRLFSWASFLQNESQMRNVAMSYAKPVITSWTGPGQNMHE